MIPKLVIAWLMGRTAKQMATVRMGWFATPVRVSQLVETVAMIRIAKRDTGVMQVLASRIQAVRMIRIVLLVSSASMGFAWVARAMPSVNRWNSVC